MPGQEIQFIYDHRLKVDRGPAGFTSEISGEIVKRYSDTDEVDWFHARQWARAMDSIRPDLLKLPDKLCRYK